MKDDLSDDAYNYATKGVAGVPKPCQSRKISRDELNWRGRAVASVRPARLFYLDTEKLQMDPPYSIY
jgi:hypothetical protein